MCESSFGAAQQWGPRWDPVFWAVKSRRGGLLGADMPGGVGAPAPSPSRGREGAAGPNTIGTSLKTERPRSARLAERSIACLFPLLVLARAKVLRRCKRVTLKRRNATMREHPARRFLMTSNVLFRSRETART